MYKLLLIEDDEVIASSIRAYLEKWNFQVHVVTDFSTVLDQFVDFQPSVVLLDIHLPFFDGYYYCEEIRRISKVPIVFISSAQDDMNVVMAVTVGADDFIEKPFKLVVLKAKLDALLRRTYDFNQEQQMMAYKQVFFDPGKDTVTYHGQTIELTKNESRILHILLEHRENIVSREEMMRSLWESEQFVDENTLSVNVNRLRKKLDEIGITDFIQTKKGRGYSV